MLRELNIQAPKIKRRKLYTPLSDEDEENSIIEVAKENTLKKVENNFVEILKPSVEKKSPQIYRTSPNALPKKKELDEDEIAENNSWKKLRSFRIFRKNPVVIKSIWQYRYRFNSVEIANEMALIKATPKINDEEKSERSKDSDEITASFVDSSQDEISFSSDNRQYTIVEIHQPSANNFLNQTRQIVNCDVLNEIFAKHEASEKKNIAKSISCFNKDDFISSQFIDNSVVVGSMEENCVNSSENQSKRLFNTDQILNEWLNIPSPKKNDFEDNTCEFSRTSLLSSSSKNLGSLKNCFL